MEPYWCHSSFETSLARLLRMRTGVLVSSSLRGAKRRSNPLTPHSAAYGLLRGACHRGALSADPLARNDDVGPLPSSSAASWWAFLVSRCFASSGPSPP